ncbi:LamG-like jellyroll fold domain-containing protein [Marinifilum fragile]|uniref:LamG-like jellyroll fold domain-containing protein n=1 Tax=Marinifilum fragile TaxID=570161 RepID=UPI002AAA66EB|nr:LamG-like jellyroll fold domain-containing protein [Marinifilum fragile]
MNFLVLNMKGASQSSLRTLALCLLLLIPIQLIGQNKPSWVSSRPINTMYYTGIGHAEKSQEDYMKVAKQKALSDLVSEIEVKVASNSLLNTLEDNAQVSTSFKEDIKVEAQRTIEDYQLVEAWENETEYWVYYQLNKYDYKEKERIRIERIQQKAYDNLQKAKRQKISGNLSGAIFNYVEGLKLIQNDLNKNLAYQVNGETIYLGNELYQSLLGAFDDVQLSAIPSSLKAQNFQAVKEPVSLIAKQGAYSIANLPLKAEFTSGSGELNANLLTNEHGSAKLQILNVTSKQSRQVVRIKPDMEKLCAANDKMVRNLIRTIKSIPEAQVTIELEEQTLKAFLRQGQYGNSALIKSVKRILSNNYFNFVPNESSADIIVDVSEEFRQGGIVSGEMYNMKEYFTSVSLQIVKRNTQETVFQYSVNDQRSLAPESTSESTARMSASRNVLKKMQRKLIQELQKLQMTIDHSAVAPTVQPRVQPERAQQNNTEPTQELLVPSGLLAYYTFDDGTGKNIMGLSNYNALVQGDHAPMVINSTLSGAGKSAQFNGDSYLAIPQHPIENWSAYTISAWVKTSSGGAILGRKAAGCTILGTTLQNQLFYQKRYSDGGYLTFDFDANRILLDNQWHMITLTVEVLKNESRSKLFVDGQMVLVENTRMQGNIKSGEGGFIGYDPGAKRYFTGEIDNLRIYNRQLRENEIQQLYFKHQ